MRFLTSPAAARDTDGLVGRAAHAGELLPLTAFLCAVAVDDIIADILASTPTVRHFLIGCEEVGTPEIEKRLPAAERRKRKHTKLRSWRRRIDRLLKSAPSRTTEETLGALSQLCVPGFVHAASVEEANRVMDEFAAVASGGRWLVGVHEEILTPEIAVIWLWRDR